MKNQLRCQQPRLEAGGRGVHKSNHPTPNFSKLSSTAFLTLLWSVHHSLEVTQILDRSTPESTIPCPTSASFAYADAASICVYPDVRACETAARTSPGADCGKGVARG